MPHQASMLLVAAWEPVLVLKFASTKHAIAQNVTEHADKQRVTADVEKNSAGDGAKPSSSS